MIVRSCGGAPLVCVRTIFWDLRPTDFVDSDSLLENEMAAKPEQSDPRDQHLFAHDLRGKPLWIVL
ncbi:hypothetical protein G8O24_41675 [Bradyrhizobium sp. INPA01-394B]|uniref:Uncharacterized protein n=1 Tax=Bradyrhizobium campsiandrae TaxID=1729892 RepID=A0ABR7UKS9_9BRAD|nr:hypothetical protein [Bradyrhizobium campsiandrae]MBC9883788.1 hypothetical protein [Bradyrhizobium campsiandrae]MBC9984544.1 hypothetical protein [Bradyrhizobium campsiandrae]